MFSNLIESSSHRSELKRRGSFLLFTTVTYAVLFAAAGVISIYAYDAHLDEQNLEIVTMMPLIDLQPEAPRETPTQPARQPDPSRRSSPEQNISVRMNPTERTDNPRLVPNEVSIEKNPSLPIPNGPWTRGDRDSDPIGPSGPGREGAGGISSEKPRSVEVAVDQPPPIEKPRPKPIIRSSTVLNSQALSLPKPPYPVIAKQAHAQGSVNVQVLIDESGKVVSAKAVSGHPLLLRAAQDAAFLARFSPTTINGQAVKVSGLITYNFVLN
jgi:protein TonB